MHVARISQAAFAVAFGLACALVASADASTLLDGAAITAAVLVIAGLVFAVSPLPKRLPEAWQATMPTADFVAIILLDLAARDVTQGVAFLAVLPAFWLGLFASTALIVVAVALTLGLVDPAAVAEPATRVAGVLGPLVVVVVALSVPWIRNRITRAAERERAASELIDRVTDTVDVGIVAVDVHGNEILANATVRNHPLLAGREGFVLDLERDGLLYGQDRVTPVPPDKGPSARAMRGEAFSNVVYWVGPPEARQHAIVMSANPLRDRSGRFSGAVFAFDEVTEYIETLRATEDFVATMSHEFRTPLTSIVGYLDLISEVSPQPTGEVSQYLGVISRNVARLRRLVENLLESSADTGKAHSRPADLANVATAAAERATDAATRRGIHIEVDALEPIKARTDAARLGHALDNLIDNAVKFSDDDQSVRITVAESPSGVAVTIADTGIGIPQREQHMLCTRFFRAVNARDGAFQGAGLGLAQADELVRSLGGTLDVESEENVGTTVTVTVPLG